MKSPLHDRALLQADQRLFKRSKVAHVEQSVKTAVEVIVCIEHSYGNKVNINSIDTIINIFGQPHGRKKTFSFSIFFLNFNENE